MNRVFYLFLDLFVILFIDYILIYSKSEADHVDHLCVVLQTLKYHYLYAKFSKFKFWLKVVTFLGYVISSEGIMMDPQKVALVRKWPRPTTQIDIQSFLGLASYYRRFVESFSKITSLLTKLTLKKVKFLWLDVCDGVLKS